MDAPRHNPDDLRDLLAAYRDVERMPATARAAAWRDLQAALADPQPAPAPRRTRVAPIVWGTVLLAAAVLLFVVRPIVLAPTPPVDPQAAPAVVDPPPERHGQRAPDPARTTVHAAPSPAADAPPASDPAPSPAADAPSASDPAPSPAADAPSASDPVPSPAADEPASPRSERPTRERTTKPEPPSIAPEPTPTTIKKPSTLERELALLRAARDALAALDPRAALTTLAEHAAEFPAGHLREERLLLRVEALCAAGDRELARAEATDFADAHPTSPHARKILRVCP